MRNKVALGFLALAVWLVSAASAWAVALGRIDVASHLGEPFYAEVPLQMDPGESISNVYVQLASPADYRILEVYRDPALNNITVDVKSDKRGPRIVLSSDSGIEAPFFNLVLKVRYERATHFKKYPVFLDIPQAAKPSAMKAIPTIKEGQRQVPIAMKPQAPPSVAPVVVSAKPAKALPGSSFKPFSGWARTSRYGPMVYGDTITTVAQRLQIDNRYSRQQVMVALFEKNRAKFDHDNINLIKAGTYLDVPTAAEVEKISPEDAHSFIARQEKVWKQLIKQPKYAAVAEAQKHRYSKRVRVGERASGEAGAPIPSASQALPGGAVQSVRKGEASPAMNAEAAQKQAQMQQQVQQLQQQNSELQSKLTAAQNQMSSMAAKSDEAGAAAANAKVKKLQIQLAQLQAERDKALQQAKAQPLPLGWLTYALAGVIVLLLIVVGYLLRREPAHPATDYPEVEPHPMTSAAPTAPMASMSPVSTTDMFEESPEIDVEEVPDTDFDSMATMQMNAADVTKEFTDSIPDLTDEDTGKMEAFEEEIEEEPDPNVDYLAEADVYLRYGMEDEAVQQVKMALKLDPHSAEAHIKLAQVLNAKNDKAALDEAVVEARQALGGSSLQQFEDAVSNLGQVTDAFADTIPPTMVEEVPAFEETVAAEETVSIPEVPAKEAEAPSEAEGLEGLDMEWPEFEEEETPLHEAEAEVEVAPEAEETPQAAPAQPASEAPSQDMEFDLSDLEIPEAGEGEEGEGPSRASSFTDTSDLEKTVAIDWSQETSVDEGGEQEDMLSESGVEGLAEVPEIAAEPEAPVEPKPEAEPTIDEGGIDLGDFDFDKVEEEKKEEQVQSASDDEFSSTIRTTSLKMTVPTETDADSLFDLSTELEEAEDTQEIAENDALTSLAASEEKKQADEEESGKAENESGLLLDLGDDFDETQKLDDLLSEFADEGEKDGDDKKG
jgi:pilus assembly protein FimV